MTRPKKSQRTARRVSVNEVLRAAYRRFARDKYTRRAMRLILR
jgi:hypothetical protein